MKKVFLLVMLVNIANAQTKYENQYTTDTICYVSDCSPTCRMNEDFKNKLSKKNPDCILGLLYFETRLDEIKRKVLSGIKIGHAEITSLQSRYSKEWSKCVKSDLYKSELDFYNDYCLRLFPLENERLANRKRITDSIKFANKAFEDEKVVKERYAKVEAEVKAREKRDAEKAEKEMAEKEKYERENLADCIKKFGTVKGRKIANGQVELGMTREMCEYAKGSFYKNTEFMKDGLKCQIWRYDNGLWLTFKGDRLVLIQD